MVKKLVLLAFLAAPFLAAGCSTSDDTTPGPSGDDTYPTNCTADSTVTASCASGTTGYSCLSGTDPESDDATRVCSDPTPDADGTSDDYCCVDSGFTAGSCTPDDSVTGACADGSFGFSCAAGDTDPSTQDPSIDQCSASTADGDSEDYCCTYVASSGGGGGGDDDTTFPSGCAADSTVSCETGSQGYSCSIGANPESDDPTRLCSEPDTSSSSEDDYCCVETGFNAGTCTPDDATTSACPDPDSYGFICASGDSSPDTQDPNLQDCSESTTDGSGTDYYCCTYN